MTLHKGNKSDFLANREIVVPVGHVLGGGSSVNFRMYSRPQRSDYNSWQAPGWSEMEDLSDLESNNGVQRAKRYISPAGKRQDTGHCHLHPRLQNGNYPKDPSEVPRVQYYMMAGVGLHPLSRGSLHITGSALRDPVDFDSGIFSDPERFDIRTCRWGYKVSRELGRRMTIYRGEAAPCHPPFAAGSAARCIETDKPLDQDAPAIQYTVEDDAMLPRDRNGVVDDSLNVYGVAGLKIADLSICPANVGGHTNNTAMTIGEKAADILIKELGLD
ncbi:GMC oxidoreductase-domain-containing protein [Apiospora saccharicola]|uniref:GMC oxidoreductase-domain-containing protein n=1 Tax=Apiospora saccharicola TaxID=335842 RepID=A0ABR1U3P2_9PEZI